QVEELQQQNEQLKSTSRSQYLDLDGRLNRLEGAGAPALPDPAGAGTPVGAAAPAPAPVDAAPRVHGDAGLIAGTADERGAYDAAFSVLKAGDYVQSAELFQDFLRVYPE